MSDEYERGWADCRREAQAITDDAMAAERRAVSEAGLLRVDLAHDLAVTRHALQQTRQALGLLVSWTTLGDGERARILATLNAPPRGPAAAAVYPEWRSGPALDDALLPREDSKHE